MNEILFIHQNFPGQFKFLAPALASNGYNVRALHLNERIHLKGVQSHKYTVKRSSTKSIHPFAVDFETKIIRGEACAQAMFELKSSGFYPDLIVAHPGWGEALFARDVFPAAKQLHFLEFFYNSTGQDVNFDHEFSDADSINKISSIRVKNSASMLSLMEMDCGYAPTHWQKSTYPDIFQNKIEVIFDGVMTDFVTPRSKSPEFLQIKSTDGSWLEFSSEDQVVTFVNRNLEPYRGYHQFVRALPEIQKKLPKVKTLIVGGDGVSYGSKPSSGRTWKDIFIDEVKDELDLSRIFFLGNLPYDKYLQLLKISSCHVYFTYPFVLSWSCVEAMSAGCIVIGSKTAPVEELITHGVNGLLVDFFDKDSLIEQVADVVNNQEKYKHLRHEARKHVVLNYDLKTCCLPKQIALVEKMLAC